MRGLEESTWSRDCEQMFRLVLFLKQACFPRDPLGENCTRMGLRALCAIPARALSPPTDLFIESAHEPVPVVKAKRLAEFFCGPPGFNIPVWHLHCQLNSHLSWSRQLVGEIIEQMGAWLGAVVLVLDGVKTSSRQRRRAASSRENCQKNWGVFGGGV